MENCVFCKIVNKEIPAELLLEDDLVVAFRDLHPIAPVHVLVIPKKHSASVAEFEKDDEVTAGRLIMSAKKIAENLGIARNGYKLLFRVGKDGGQEVDHVHLHLIGGARLREDIGPV